MKEFIRVDGVEDGINFDGRFQVQGSAGVAYYLLGWEAEQKPMICFVERCEECGEPLHNDDDHEYVAKEYEEEDWSETELVRSGDNVIAVMVGDDHKWSVDKSDLIEINEDDYCAECGQIGCCGDGRDRSEAA